MRRQPFLPMLLAPNSKRHAYPQVWRRRLGNAQVQEEVIMRVTTCLVPFRRGDLANPKPAGGRHYAAPATTAPPAVPPAEGS